MTRILPIKLNNSGGAPANRIETDRLKALVIRWNDTAEKFSRYGDVGTAKTLTQCADELTTAVKEESESLVGLREAATISGYSADHLGRLVRQARIPNRGRLHKPLVRVSDLPRKPVDIAANRPRLYDPITDARTLRSRDKRTA